QYFGVAQRRRRVFVVGHLGDWRAAAAVLFERDSLSGNPAPRREAGEGFAADVAPSLTASGRGVERTGETRGQDPVVAMCLNAKAGSLHVGQTPAVAMSVALRGRDGGATAELGDDLAGCLRASSGGGDKPHVLTSAVRRLTPRECERLQGFPDDYTLIPWRGKPAELCPDGPRYKALGNSMAVPVMRWIGERIEQ